jgi:membrane carboxypeptidase/penicillin-binding protein PbpC
MLAPHFVQQVLELKLVGTQRGVPTHRENLGEITSTLDLAKQQLIERRISDYIATNRARGIQNAAALLVD